MELFIRPIHLYPETLSRCFCVDFSHGKISCENVLMNFVWIFFVYRWSLLTQCFLYSLRKLSFSISRRPLLWLELTHCPQSTDSYHFSIHDTCYTTRFFLACFTSWAYEGTIRKFLFILHFDFDEFLPFSWIKKKPLKLSDSVSALAKTLPSEHFEWDRARRVREEKSVRELSLIQFGRRKTFCQ